MIRNFLNLLAVLLALIILSSCSTTAKATDGTATMNSKTSIKKPYVILISLDGFRWDYVEKYKPPHLTNFIENGVKAESLIPSFPSKTFPNHYTIATGMYPDKHGIIGNSFYSYKKKTTYKLGNRETVEDGSFYGGTPIWILADKNQMVSASYFFVGSEANIQGKYPTYYKIYDGSIKNETRVKQAIEWLALPEEKRPHMITMYFSDMDNTGHDFGPNNDAELKKTLFELDKNLGDLFKGTAATGLPINIVIVSDHGMTEQKTENLIPIEKVINDSLYVTIDNGAIVNIHPKKQSDTDAIYTNLKQKETHFKVYKTENTPGFEDTPQNKDWGTLQLIPDYGYYFSSNSRIASYKKNNIKIMGIHGPDTKYKDMHGIFYANGPGFKNGYEVASFKNIHVYPLLCKLLGLPIPNTIDGKLEEIQGVLK